MDEGALFMVALGGVFLLYAVRAMRTLRILQGWAKDGGQWRHEYYKRLMYTGASRRVAYETSRESRLWNVIVAVVLGGAGVLLVITGLS